MDCEQVRERILRSDDPAAVAAGDADVARHVEGCAGCRALVATLGRVERVAGGLPAPADSEAAKRAVIERLRRVGVPTPAPSHRRWFLRPAVVGGIAAVLLVGIGLAGWVGRERRSPQQAAVVERLIDFDLALAEASPEQREQLFAREALALRAAVQQAVLTDEDRQLAATVLEKDAWLQQNSDPVGRAERLGDLGDLLVGRMDHAAAANDESAVQRLGSKFGKVQKGLGAQLDAWGAVADVTPERTAQQVKRLERLERVAKRQEAARKRLEKIAEKSPQRAQRVLRRMLENAERARQQQPRTTQPRLDPKMH